MWTVQIARTCRCSTKKGYLNCGFVVGESESKMVVESNVSPYPAREISLRQIIQLKCWTLHGLDWRCHQFFPFGFNSELTMSSEGQGTLAFRRLMIMRFGLLQSFWSIGCRFSSHKSCVNHSTIQISLRILLWFNLRKQAKLNLSNLIWLPSSQKQTIFWNWLSNEIATAYHNCLRHIRPSEASSAYWGWKSLWKRRKCKNPSGVLGCLTPKSHWMDAGRFGVQNCSMYGHVLRKCDLVVVIEVHLMEANLDPNTLALLGPTSQQKQWENSTQKSDFCRTQNGFMCTQYVILYKLYCCTYVFRWWAKTVYIYT